MINASSNPYQIYRQTAVETASPAKLLIMLFDGAIKFSNEAKQALEQKEFENANNAMLKVQDILSELMVTLDMNQGDMAKHLYNLYKFYQGEVISANIQKDPLKLQPVIEFFEMFRETWIEVSKKVREEH
ncbi:flagellar protein FliS [Sporomusaceae bacterium FL31]|nr:flagellar protein FliS [Sporomusaceae bacterium FL31]